MWLAVVLLAGACHRSAPAAAPAAPDLARATLTCAGLQGCIERCPRDGQTACAEACVARLEPSARPYFEALQTCVIPACASAPDGGSSPCSDATSFGCKMCVTARCPQLVSTCLLH